MYKRVNKTSGNCGKILQNIKFICVIVEPQRVVLRNARTHGGPLDDSDEEKKRKCNKYNARRGY